MASIPPVPKSYSLQLAERIHSATGKEHLTRICIGGFLLESAWHSVIERRVLKTPTPAVKKAMFRAAATWPVIYVATSAAVSWAAWKVGQAAKPESGQARRDS
ncbi:hypothetical protein GGS24DRAFT_498178 [Hypoxylon argillaceum]|nr:hypothetical protein GGS24DRAFT_498178 [Hypoxylon argillaceum]KAI1152940.1 hypothetical protein F4825DRAFT_450022 [Nemania diffusa]